MSNVLNALYSSYLRVLISVKFFGLQIAMKKEEYTIDAINNLLILFNIIKLRAMKALSFYTYNRHQYR